MKVILYDLDHSYAAVVESKCDHAIVADGKYAPCQGCFGCWTKHPAECFMKDKLQQVCRIIGQADELAPLSKIYWTAPSEHPRLSAPTGEDRCIIHSDTGSMICGR